jgi:hypothetical protein
MVEVATGIAHEMAWAGDRPSALTPVATSTWVLTTRPASRTFIVNAFAARNVYGPGPEAGCGSPRRARRAPWPSPRPATSTAWFCRGSRRASQSAGSKPRAGAGRHHRGQRPLCSPAALEKPVREVGPLTQFGDRDFHRAGPGVEVPGPVAIAGVGPLRGPLADAAHTGPSYTTPVDSTRCWFCVASNRRPPGSEGGAGECRRSGAVLCV